MSNETITVDGHEFILSPHEGRRGEDGPFRLKKPRWMIDRYLEVAERFPGARMVELGLWDGGSTAFLASSFQPEVLVGFELSTKELHRLDAFLADSPLRDRVHTHLGVDQADGETLRRCIAEHHDGPLDVIVDDASHILAPSEATFDCLFPMLRPGGVFIVEDWSHEHQSHYNMRRAIERGDLDPAVFENAAPASSFPNPQSRLVLDAVLATANDDGIIAEVITRHGWSEIRRGSTELDPENFSMLDLIGPYGRRVNPRSIDDI